MFLFLCVPLLGRQSEAGGQSVVRDEARRSLRAMWGVSTIKRAR